MATDLHLPWRVAISVGGKIAIVDNRNNGKTTTSGRVCNLPRGKNDRGLIVARAICAAVNKGK